MEEKEKVLTLCIPGGCDIKEAARRVRRLLRERADLGAVEVEVLPGPRETLLLIHPAVGMYIDRRAVEFLAGY